MSDSIRYEDFLSPSDIPEWIAAAFFKANENISYTIPVKEKENEESLKRKNIEIIHSKIDEKIREIDNIYMLFHIEDYEILKIKRATLIRNKDCLINANSIDFLISDRDQSLGFASFIEENEIKVCEW